VENIWDPVDIDGGGVVVLCMQMYKVWFGLHEDFYDGYVVLDEAVNVVFDRW